MAMSWSQRITLGVTVAYIATALIHLKGDRKGLGLMFAGYSVANFGAYLLEAKQ